jgi:peptidoglycan glycosyltransferase
MKHPRLRELVLICVVAVIFAMGYVQLGNAVALPFITFLVVFAAVHVGARVLVPRADPVLVPVAGLLVAIGSMQLAAIDRLAKTANASWRVLAPVQAGWLVVSGAAFLAIVFIFRNGLGPAWRVRYTLALLGLGSILLPLAPGIGRTVNGARLWLRFGPLSFQPVEAAKILVVLFLAAYLSERRELLGLPTRRVGFVQLPDPRYLAPILALVGLAVVILVGQNDLGPSLLFFLTFVALLWISTGKAYYPVVGLVLFGAAVYLAVHSFPHVAVRMVAWLHPYSDPQGAGYQLIQGQYALAEGGISGTGLAGALAQPNLIPFGWTDLMLITIGHTLGLAGILAVIMAMLLLMTRTFLIALRSRSDLHALAAAGFGVVLGTQAALIAGGVTRVLPFTGVTLPFVSYGGSSLLANFVILGSLMAISHNESTTSLPADAQLEEAAA